MRKIDPMTSPRREAARPAGRQRGFGAAGGLWLRLAALSAAALLGGCGYGRMQELDELASTARSEIEIQLQRRAELVPNLIETVRAYGVAEDVEGPLADARARLVRAVRSGDLRAIEEGSARLSGAIGGLLSAAGRQPDLQLDAGFRILRSRLDGTEERIRAAGRAYNDAVGQYNSYIRRFPQLVTAKVIGAERLETLDLGYADVQVMSSGDE